MTIHLNKLNSKFTQTSILIRVGLKLNRQLMIMWLILGTHKNFFVENQAIFLQRTMCFATTIMPRYNLRSCHNNFKHKFFVNSNIDQIRLQLLMYKLSIIYYPQTKDLLNWFCNVGKFHTFFKSTSTRKETNVNLLKLNTTKIKILKK